MVYQKQSLDNYIMGNFFIIKGVFKDCIRKLKNQESNFDELPNEILTYIASYLTPADIVQPTHYLDSEVYYDLDITMNDNWWSRRA